jgi:hypothetical protein
VSVGRPRLLTPRRVSRDRAWTLSRLAVLNPESPIEILERWEAHGATWRVLMLTGELAVVELCTCYGEPVDELRSSDPELIRYLASAQRS